jgi:phosphatidate cytidylyltransferase
MLHTRILTALVLLGILTLAATTSMVLLLAVGAFLLAACLYEWLLLSPAQARAARIGAVAAGLFAWLVGLQQPSVVPGWMLALWLFSAVSWGGIVLVLIHVQRGGVLPLQAHGLQAMAWGLCLSAWFALAFLLQTGVVWTLSVLALVWIADISAYAFGRLFGRARLADRLSPGKTWAGVWGALGTVLVLAHGLHLLAPHLSLWTSSLLDRFPVLGSVFLVVLVALSIAGDLFESAVKRRAGVKDSGRLLPGHGGAWDRLDASLPVLPLAAVVQTLLLTGSAHV